MPIWTNTTEIAGDEVHNSAFYKHYSYSYAFLRSVIINKLLSGETTVLVYNVSEYPLLSSQFLYKSSFYIVRIKCIHLPLGVDFYDLRYNDNFLHKMEYYRETLALQVT